MIQLLARNRVPFTVSMLVLSMIAVLVFGTQGYRAGRRILAGPQPVVRSWMTIPTIAHRFDIPEDDLYRELGVAPERPDRRPLNVLAQQAGRTVADEVAAVQQIVDAHRPQSPPALTP